MKKSISILLKSVILIISFTYILLSFKSLNSFSSTLNIDDNSSRKVVYLTFDDGPSKNTPKILDILKEHDVKATFFIIYPYIDSHIDIVKRAYEEGHAIGNHTANHEFKYVYTSEEAFFNNFSKQQAFIKSVTGSPSTVFRFPGGSGNTIVRSARGKDFTKNITEKLKEQGVTCYDWNVDSGDAHGNDIPAMKLLTNVIYELKDKEGNEKNPAIVLMHDCMTKTTTVEALPNIIKFFKEKGYEFDILK